jgi:hypothetical protein
LDMCADDIRTLRRNTFCSGNTTNSSATSLAPYTSTTLPTNKLAILTTVARQKTLCSRKALGGDFCFLEIVNALEEKDPSLAADAYNAAKEDFAALARVLNALSVYTDIQSTWCYQKIAADYQTFLSGASTDELKFWNDVVAPLITDQQATQPTPTVVASSSTASPTSTDSPTSTKTPTPTPTRAAALTMERSSLVGLLPVILLLL